MQISFFVLPSLETRRDIAMLDSLQQAASKLPPWHFWQWVMEDRSVAIGKKQPQHSAALTRGARSNLRMLE